MLQNFIFYKFDETFGRKYRKHPKEFFQILKDVLNKTVKLAKILE